jgi:hypothetical protein
LWVGPFGLAGTTIFSTNSNRHIPSCRNCLSAKVLPQDHRMAIDISLALGFIPLYPLFLFVVCTNYFYISIIICRGRRPTSFILKRVARYINKLGSKPEDTQECNYKLPINFVMTCECPKRPINQVDYEDGSDWYLVGFWKIARQISDVNILSHNFPFHLLSPDPWSSNHRKRRCN